MWIRSLHTYGRLIKFSHTIFALPFALSAALLAHRQTPLTARTLLWIILAMAGARSAAMGFNRLVDRRFDALNPRTASRPSVTGEISVRAMGLLVLLSSALFVLSAAMLGDLCLKLSLPCLMVLFFYSYTKRFTAGSHLVLGFAIGLAPVGAWIAVTGSLDGRILLLSAALMTYIAGFDILYACQDVDFDTSAGLHSLPSRWGLTRALAFSSALHVLTVLALAAMGLAFHLGGLFFALLALISGLLLVEHRMVRPDRLEAIPVAFFHVNSVVSVLLFVAVWLDLRLS
ncbi:4-hydroxybenzoate polyprenyltransferase [Desulfacinum hydrothermale DSM 13146]|uniref:4-hydroxybenzoate polyprenyltransferase n=1 Tax=Desulfacinum hydrothermale DSM 13146 TaxID=1121390 RepID=A0A1W1XC95_9BACT|nr:UbiA-like polyprenyltransferase [Desulfacinum hydrothermale]SMC21308.1 4-hydroxybenzoate polyprenyltransferase [Desulfacinum hydrothermale DSM 13146]